MTPRAPPLPPPGALSRDHIESVRARSMKPVPTRVDVAVSCDLPVCDPTGDARSLTSRDEVDGLEIAQPPLPQQPSSQAPAPQGRFRRWLQTLALGGRREGLGASTGSSHYEQPEVSEATVVSSVHEDEDAVSAVTSSSRRESIDVEEGNIAREIPGSQGDVTLGVDDSHDLSINDLEEDDDDDDDEESGIHGGRHSPDSHIPLLIDSVRNGNTSSVSSISEAITGGEE